MARASAPALAPVIPDGEHSFRALERAERAFPVRGRRRVVAAHFGVEVDNPGLLPLIAQCAEFDLSPTSGLVHLIPHKVKTPGPDGADTEVVRWSPAIGRDGLIHLARRTLGKPYGYRGHRVAWIGARDELEVYLAQDGEPIVHHTLARKEASNVVVALRDARKARDDPARWRGEVVGAWAVAYFDALPTAFYHADIRQYGQLETLLAGDGEEAEDIGYAGAWRYTSAMAEKCGEARVLRQGLGVTGFVPIDELMDVGAFQRGEHSMGVFADGRERSGALFDFGSIADEELRGELHEAVRRVNELEPFSWPPAKLALMLTGRDEEQQRAVLERLHVEVATREASIAKPPAPKWPPRRATGRRRRRRAPRARATARRR